MTVFAVTLVSHRQVRQRTTPERLLRRFPQTSIPVGCADDRKHNLRRRFVVPRTARHNLRPWHEGFRNSPKAKRLSSAAAARALEAMGKAARVQVVDTGRFVREDALEVGKGLRRRQIRRQLGWHPHRIGRLPVGGNRIGMQTTTSRCRGSTGPEQRSTGTGRHIEVSPAPFPLTDTEKRSILTADSAIVDGVRNRAY